MLKASNTVMSLQSRAVLRAEAELNAKRASARSLTLAAAGSCSMDNLWECESEVTDVERGVSVSKSG